jgi:hypothetical protein
MILQGYPERSRFYQQGEAKALLRVLTARGFTIPGEVRARVLACADVAQLEAWIDRAVTADRIEAVFEQEAGSGA